MTMRLSTGLRNFLAAGGSIASALDNGRIEIYSGAQPTSADAAVQGTLLCTITANSGAITAETPATGSMTISGTSGSINTLTVNGINILPSAVPFNGTLNQTAIDVARAVNAGNMYPGYSASASGAVVTITARPGAGANPNGFVVSGSATTLTTSFTNMSGGVAPINGLSLDAASAGSISKLASQVWSGVNAAGGTGGWFRQYGSFADAGALDSAAAFNRIDGAIATAGAEMNMSSTAFVAGATTTVASWSLLVPAN